MWFACSHGQRPRFTRLKRRTPPSQFSKFSSGALGVLQATTAAYPGYQRRLELTGSEGTVILEQDLILAANLRHAPPGFSQGQHEPTKIRARGLPW